MEILSVESRLPWLRESADEHVEARVLFQLGTAKQRRYAIEGKAHPPSLAKIQQ
jgi:hypothetical protein